MYEYDYSLYAVIHSYDSADCIFISILVIESRLINETRYRPIIIIDERAISFFVDRNI